MTDVFTSVLHPFGGYRLGRRLRFIAALSAALIEVALRGFVHLNLPDMANTKERVLFRLPFQKSYTVSVAATKAANLDDGGIHHIFEGRFNEHYTDSDGNDQVRITAGGAAFRSDPKDKEYYAAKAREAAAD